MEDGPTTSTVVVEHAEDSLDSITRWSIGTAATLGTVTNNNNGTFSYNPTTSTAFETLQVGNTAIDTFTYTVTDNHGVTASATASVTVSVSDKIGRASSGERV